MIKTARPAPVLTATRSLLLASVFLLAACSSTGEKSDVVDAAATPLSDLNLLKTKIPAVLLAARQAPYRIPAEPSCAALQAEVRALSEVLGNDYDTPTATGGSRNRGVAAVGKAAVKTVKRTAEGIVPFRSWVRKLTGAERASKEVAAAVAAGAARRSFLKGMLAAKDCAPEATPVVVDADDDAEEEEAIAQPALQSTGETPVQ